ncbi:outer membrane beta-barrel protein [Rubrolithibacter danxiaensis]|uniref:outer membrane beta-barrel protein n=1 Tax=Rubrolithibacter danxiaensis TaxID=3390805 RepID=UPI003BF83C7E
MKKTTKFIASAVAAAALLISSNLKAQTTEPAGDSHATRFGIGLSLGNATKDPWGFAIGGDLRLQKDFSSNVSGLLSAGYTNISVKDKFDGLGIDSYDLIPVKAGIKVFPVERFYISGELGAGFGLDEGAKTSFIYAPGIGLGFNNGLDLGLRYEGYSVNNSNIGQVALRIAYGFRL